MEHIKVFAWGHQVGEVRQAPHSGHFGLAYAPQWIERKIELAPLMMPRRDGLHAHPKLPEATFLRLPGLVAGALPDEFGSHLIRLWLERNGVERPSVLDHLSVLGTRGMGALEFLPHLEPEALCDPLDVAQLVEQSCRVVNGQARAHDTGLDALLRVGISAGGQRAKIVVALDRAKNILLDAPRPDTVHEQWLIKLDGVFPHAKDGAFEPGTPRGKGRVEYAYFLMARAAGLDMEDCRLWEEQGRAHFMTRRFDRQGKQKRHVATLCDMAHLDYKAKATHTYDSLFDTIDRLGLDGNARHQAFRRMCFNVMARNQDDHTKNFGFLLKEGEEWALAPAYDLTYANNPASEWVHQHLMGVNGKFKNIEREDLRAVGQRWHVPEVGNALDAVAEAVSAWPIHAQAAGMGQEATAEIGQQLRPLGPGLGKRKTPRIPAATARRSENPATGNLRAGQAGGTQ